MSEDLQVLFDKQVIYEVFYKYCCLVDCFDVVLGYSVFYEDFYVDYGVDVYQGLGQGCIDVIIKMYDYLIGYLYQILNIFVVFDGDCVGSEVYMIGMMWMV